jgi:hypothetical protein
MYTLFIQSSDDEASLDFVGFAGANGYGIEITCFALPWMLDDNLAFLLRFWKGALKNFENEVAVHGVFMDMITASRDAKIVGVTKERILQNIKIAEQLKAKIVIFSSCFNPCIATSSPSYIEGY